MDDLALFLRHSVMYSQVTPYMLVLPTRTQQLALRVLWQLLD